MEQARIEAQNIRFELKHDPRVLAAYAEEEKFEEGTYEAEQAGIESCEVWQNAVNKLVAKLPAGLQEATHIAINIQMARCCGVI